MSRRRLLAVLFGVLFTAVFATSRAAAQGLEPIRYTLTFPAPQTHYVEVEAVVPTGRKAEVDLMMATWTPGSYLMREYSRHVEDVKAGNGLSVTKTAKNHWRIATGGAAAVTVSYRVYGREMSVRTNWIDSRFALLNGAATYLTLNEPRAKRPHDVRVILPDAWKITMTGLPAVSGDAGVAHHYVAADFDTLVDSPILAGNPAVYEFEAGGKKHYLVNEGEAGVFNGEYAVKDVQKIAQAAVTMWGSAPYEKYVFLNLLTEGGGGLEHRNSTVLMASRWATSTAQRYQNWLGLVSHEFFHAWNVKRLRPVELGPFDYDREVYTSSLWIAEGVTDYYGDVMLRRAGLTDDGELVAGVGQLIRTLQTTPGRLVQPVEDASFDAWIRHYRPDENSPNVAISYYTKGAVLGFLLDAKIRKATGGAKSLDDVMRLAMQRYGGAKGYTPREFQQTVHEVAGTDFGTWWHDVLDTTKELDYSEALDWYGLRFRPADERQARATLGLNTRVDGGRLLVSQVRRGTPGYDAGINVDDEIVALGDFRVRADAWAASMDRYQPGQRVSVLVARRDQLMRLDATFGREAADQWRLEISPDATAEQRQHLSALSSGAAPSTDHRTPWGDMPGYDLNIDLGKDGKIGVRHYAPERDYALGATYVMAPGASLGHDSTFLVTFGELLSERGLDVVTFNFPFLQRGSKRPDGNPKLEHCYRAVMNRVATTPALANQPLIAGGKSMGGRIASFLAARPDGFEQPVAGLIFLGYPLHPPQRPEQLRVVHLPDVKVPMLFVQGTRDPFGTPLQLEPVLSTLETPARVHRVMGGDHSFALPRKWTGAEPQLFDAAARAIAEWVTTEILADRSTTAQPSRLAAPTSVGANETLKRGDE